MHRQLPESAVDLDPCETAEWIEALDQVAEKTGSGAVSVLLDRLMARARAKGVEVPGYLTPVERQDAIGTRYPADRVPVSRLEMTAPVAGVPLRWEPLSRRKATEGRLLYAGRASTVPSLSMTACRTNGLGDRLASLQPEGVSLATVVIFETARLLRKYPAFNSCFSGGKAACYEEVNIGCAIDSGEGLLVPVIRKADEKNLSEISACLRRHLEAYVENRLQAADLAGGTFTVSDLSGEDVSSFIPLISPGQSAILGIGAETFLSENSPGFFQLILSYDHQLSEGRSAAIFLRELKERLAAYDEVAGAGAESFRQRREVYCAICNRGPGELKPLKACLVNSVEPEGMVCSFCLGGY